MLRRFVVGTLLALFSIIPAAAQKKSASSEQRASAYFEKVKGQPSLLFAFLRDMPKGGDLHNHLSGAIYAESFIKWAVQDGLCVDTASSSFVPPPCDPAQGKPPASAAYQDANLYARLLDAFSMRGWHPAMESGHDHFFATFGKFGAATSQHTADMLAEVRSLSAAQHLEYLELMFNPDGNASGRLAARLGWDEDLGKMRDRMLSGGLREIVSAASRGLDEVEAAEQKELQCGTAQADAGCNVQARYLYQVARGLPKEQVFGQILAGFEMASRDPRVVGLNLVMAEDWYVPIHDFRLHMQIIDFLHKLYPKVHITLHAGELTPQIAAPEDFFHIRASVEQGHAERIGHGVDVMQEGDPLGLLKEMAKKNVLVEICLTSNDGILGVIGNRHPLPMYLKFGVPVALATDDAGVSRSSITQEYQRAAETYNLRYADLKRMARASIAYSFLPGQSLWADLQHARRVKACAADAPAGDHPSTECARLVKSSEKARAEWELEKQLAAFEVHF